MGYTYKPVLQPRIIKERKEQAEQEALRKKYGITGNRAIQVKKEHFFTAVSKAFGKVLRKMVTLLLLILAFNGAIAFLHPDSRTALTYVYTQAMYQAKELCPPLKDFIK